MPVSSLTILRMRGEESPCFVMNKPVLEDFCKVLIVNMDVKLKNKCFKTSFRFDRSV